MSRPPPHPTNPANLTLNKWTSNLSHLAREESTNPMLKTTADESPAALDTTGATGTPSARTIAYQTIERRLQSQTDRQFADWITSLHPTTRIESSPYLAAPGSAQHVRREIWGSMKSDEHIDKFQKAVISAFPPPHKAVLISTLTTTHIKDRMDPTAAHSLDPWSRRGVPSIIHDTNPRHPLETGLAVLQLFKGQHFTALTTDGHTTHLYDSLSHYNDEADCQNIIDKINRFYDNLAVGDQTHIAIPPPTVKNCPPQTDGWSCGAHMCAVTFSTIYQHSASSQLRYTQDHIYQLHRAMLTFYLTGRLIPWLGKFVRAISNPDNNEAYVDMTPPQYPSAGGGPLGPQESTPPSSSISTSTIQTTESYQPSRTTRRHKTDPQRPRKTRPPGGRHPPLPQGTARPPSAALEPTKPTRPPMKRRGGTTRLTHKPGGTSKPPPRTLDLPTNTTELLLQRSTRAKRRETIRKRLLKATNQNQLSKYWPDIRPQSLPLIPQQPSPRRAPRTHNLHSLGWGRHPPTQDASTTTPSTPAKADGRGEPTGSPTGKGNKDPSGGGRQETSPPLPTRPNPPNTEDNRNGAVLKLATLNIQKTGKGSPSGTDIISLITAECPDILFLTETPFDKDCPPLCHILSNQGYYIHFRPTRSPNPPTDIPEEARIPAHGTSGGCLLAFKKKQPWSHAISPVFLPREFPAETLCALEITLTKQRKCLIVCCYLPHNDGAHKEACHTIQSLQSQFPDHSIILGGDLQGDWQGNNNKARNIRTHLTFDRFHGPVLPTFAPPLRPETTTCIDHFARSPETPAEWQTLPTYTRDSVFLDHKSLLTTISLPITPRAPMGPPNTSSLNEGTGHGLPTHKLRFPIPRQDLNKWKCAVREATETACTDLQVDLQSLLSSLDLSPRPPPTPWGWTRLLSRRHSALQLPSIPSYRPDSR